MIRQIFLRLPLLFAILTAVGGVPAYAETVELSCGHSGGVDVYVSIDLGAGTAKLWANIVTRNDVPANPATITDDTVTWTAAISKPDAADRFTFDRNTGALNETEAGGQTYSWICKKAAKIF